MRYGTLLIAGWSVLIAGLITWAVRLQEEQTTRLAHAEARAHFNKDLAFRLWATSHGGVYVPVDEHTPPSPYLEHIPERDIVTPSGAELTLMNPAYMVRQMMERFGDLYGAEGHITSLQPIRPENAPDRWERTALEAFNRGEVEFSEVTAIDGQPFLRLMRPIITEAECLKCHAFQGYAVGDVRGGVGVAIPLADHLDRQRSATFTSVTSFGIVWIAGLAGIAFAFLQIRARVREREEAESNLAEAHARLSATLDALPDLRFEVDHNGTILDYRAPHPDLLYAAPETFLGKKVDEVLPAPAGQISLECIQEAVQHGCARGATYSLDMPEGKAWYELSAATGGGSPPRVIVLVRDVTDRHISIEAMDISERKYRTLFEEATDGICLADPETGIILDCNKAMARMVERTRDEIIGQHQRFLQPNGGASEILEGFRKQANGEVEHAFEAQLITSCGALREVEIKADLVEIDGRRVLQGIFCDITERTQAALALRESEARVRLLLDSTAEAIYGLDTHGNCTFANPSCVKMLGYADPADLLGKQMHDLIHHSKPDGSPYPEASCPIYLAFRQGEGSYLESEVLWRSDGSPLHVELWSYPIVRDNVVVGSVVTFFDISKRLQAEFEHQELEAQFRQAQKMEAVGLLAGGIAHDFNNLLQVIRGYGELLQGRFDTNSGSGRELAEVMTAAERAATLVAQLLAFGRRQVLELTELNLNEVVGELMKMIRRIIGEHIVFDVTLCHELAVVRADRGQIEQVVMNLCLNARDAMSDGGRLHITTRENTIDESFSANQPWARPGHFIVLEVTDSGCGMSSETLEHIFEPFFTTKAKGEGTGLGLATAYGIIRQHEGFINVISQLEQGTTIEIYLPAITPGQTKNSIETAQTPPGGHETILLAEDDPGVRKLIQSILEKAGYSVITAEDGEQALVLLESRAGEIDLAILDAVMPKLGGPGILDRVKTDIPVKFLLASGYSSEILKAGCDGVQLLRKPFTNTSLLAKIREILDGGH